ncbi:MAG: hypothetical protein ACREKS_02245 [Candidatus Rokuibacteriota bacterium]
MRGRRVPAILPLLFLVGCTSVGGLSAKPTASTNDGFTLRVCVLRDPAVSEARVNELFEAWQEELAPLGIQPIISDMREEPRPSFTAFGAFSTLEERSLGPNCDRLALLVGRNAGDVAYGVAATFMGLPEVHGAVDTKTHTRMYLVAETASLPHALFGGAKGGIIHEGYHLLGCGHWSWADCYKQIDKLKALARERTTDFVPAITESGRIYRTREEVERTYATSRQDASAPREARGGQPAVP